MCRASKSLFIAFVVVLSEVSREIQLTPTLVFMLYNIYSSKKNCGFVCYGLGYGNHGYRKAKLDNAMMCQAHYANMR